MRTILATVMIAAISAGAAQTDLVAYWNFNEFDPSTETTLVADQGSGSISLEDWGGDLENNPGSTDNALSSDLAGKTLTLEGGQDLAGNGTYIEISFSMAGSEDLDVSYWTRRSDSGFNSNQWSYSTDGATFTNFGSTIDPNNTSSGEVITLPTLTMLNNVSTAYLRYTLDGSSSSAGSNRIDNLQLNATIPEPASVTLLVLGGLLIARRKHCCLRDFLAHKG